MVALGDLSGFPALCKLTFSFYEVQLCMSLHGGVVRHTSLASIVFDFAHPAPECVPMVLQLSQDLRRLRRGSMIKLGAGGSWHYERWGNRAVQSAQALPPFHKFRAALELCAL